MQYRFGGAYCMKLLHTRNSIESHSIASRERTMQSYYILGLAEQELDQEGQELDQEEQIVLEISDFFAY